MTLEQAILHPSASVIVLSEITVPVWVRNWINLGSFLATNQTDTGDDTLTESGDTLTTEAGDTLVLENGDLTTTEDGFFLVTESSNTYSATVPFQVNSVTFNGVDLTLNPSLDSLDETPGSWLYISGTLYVNPPEGESMYGNANAVQAFTTFYFSNYAKTLSNRFYDPRLKSAPNLSTRIEKQFSGVGQIGGGTISFLNADKFFDALQDIQWNAGTVTLRLGIDVPPNRIMDVADYRTLATWAIEDWESDAEFKLKLVERKSKLRNKLPNFFYDKERYPSLADDDVGKAIPIGFGKVLGVKPTLIDPITRRFKVAQHAIHTLDGVRILNKDSGVWENSDFTGRVLLEGEFTLGPDYEEGDEVSVDFTGLIDEDLIPITNAAAIVQMLLLMVGELNVNQASFDAAFARLDAGTNSDGERVTLRAPSVYIDTPTDLIAVIGKINEAVGSYLYCDASGQYVFGVFEPMPSEALAIFKDIDVLTFKENTETGNIVSQVSILYASRPQDETNLSLVLSRTGIEYANGFNAPALQEKELSLTRPADVQYWAERFLTMNAAPLRWFTIEVPWRGFTLLPGDQIKLEYARRNIDAVLEVLEVRLDLGAKKTYLVLGDLRGLRDTAGFWVDDAAVLPTRFSALAGYGSGSLSWNKDWDPTIKSWARRNVGYWQTESGLAHASDPASWLAGSWV